MAPVNYASWLLSANTPLEVATAPLPDPSSLADDEIIVKSRAVAINPVDWKVRDSPPNDNRFGIQYPYILGEDVAGEVVHLGAGVQGLRKGDRVVAHALGLGAGDAAYGAFQLYVKLRTATVARIPDCMAYEAAAVLPLSVSTAAAGLFMQATLGLDLPDVPTLPSSSSFSFSSSSASASASTSSSSSSTSSRLAARPSKGMLLLWGGSSSVGAGVVQLAVAAGYSVVATASPANYGFVKALGAAFVVDYHNPDIVGILTAMLVGLGGDGDGGDSGPLVGAYDAIGSETTVRQTAAVLSSVVARGRRGLGRRTPARVASVGAAPADVGERGVEVVRIGSTGIVSAEPRVARRVWGAYVPAALEAGTLRPAPRETVVGAGLYYVQGALDMNRRGVSAAKVVVSL